VIIADINDAGGQRVASTMPSHMFFHHANVAKEADWKHLMAMAHEKYGRVDILVNNAGTSYKNKVYHTMKLQRSC